MLRNNDPRLTVMDDCEVLNNASATLLGETLQDNTHLSKLNLRICGSTSEEGLRAILTGMSYSQVSTLLVYHNKDCHFTQELFRGLHNVSSLRHLYCAKVGDGESRAPQLSTEVLCKTFVCLEFVSLIGATSSTLLHGLGLALAQNTTVKALKLSHMDLRQQNMQALWTNALCLNNIISSLKLEDCQINDASVSLFCLSWSTESHIQHLKLPKNLLRPSAVLHLMSHVQENLPLMQSINLNGNIHIDYGGFIKIFSNLSCHHIKKICLRDCTRERVYTNHIVVGNMVRPQDHMIHPTLTVRTDTSGSRTTYDVYHRTKENANRATWHQ